MAREIGRLADKDGNEFERLWLVSLALRALAGEITSLHWERAGEIGFGIECEVTFPDGRRQVHQCKIENGALGRWSAADLAAAGVLDAALRHLQRPGVAEFVFVSRDPVLVLRDLGVPPLGIASRRKRYWPQKSRCCRGVPTTFLFRRSTTCPPPRRPRPPTQAWAMEGAAPDGNRGPNRGPPASLRSAAARPRGPRSAVSTVACKPAPGPPPHPPSTYRPRRLAHLPQPRRRRLM